MYVSSFKTFVHSNTTQKTYKEKENTPTKELESSSFKNILNTVESGSSIKPQLPINYISGYKVLNNQQKLQSDNKNPELLKFSKVNAQNNAQEKYVEDKTMFSLLKKPKATLHQTPRVSSKLSPEIQDITIQNLRNTMIDTYTANENYYQITSVA